MNKELKICVRMPNWLGDAVMSFGFINMLIKAYPSAQITVVIKQGLEQIVEMIPGIHRIQTFSKNDYKGLKGVWKYGKELGKLDDFDLFFVLPDSFSSAVMAYASGAKKRIGFSSQGRNFLLTDIFKKPIGKHRVEDYASLLQQYNPALENEQPTIQLLLSKPKKNEPYIVINTNSESVTSRLPQPKAVELLSIYQQYGLPIKLIGSKKELPYVTSIADALQNKDNIEILAGKTSLHDLISLLQSASFVITTDSGPAHIASALGVPMVVITGAGDERNTGPFNNPHAVAVRNGTLPCEPCVKNYCKLGALPVCLEKLELQKVKTAMEKLLVSIG